MTKTTFDPSFESLQKLAEAATIEVRAEASRDGSLLPVWRDGRVMLLDPVSGSVIGPAAHEDLTRLKSQLRVLKPRIRQPVRG